MPKNALGSLCTAQHFAMQLRCDEVLKPLQLKLQVKSQQDACFIGLFLSLEAAFRPPGTLRPQRGQPLAVLVEVNQRKGSQQPLVILL